MKNVVPLTLVKNEKYHSANNPHILYEAKLWFLLKIYEIFIKMLPYLTHLYHVFDRFPTQGA
jgi:hypothetical protein